MGTKMGKGSAGRKKLEDKLKLKKSDEDSKVFRLSEPCESTLDYIEDVLEEDGDPPGLLHYEMTLTLHANIMKKRKARGKKATRWMCRCPGVKPSQRSKCKCSAIKIFAGQLDLHGLSPGTVGKYVGHVSSWIKHLQENWTRAELRCLHRIREIYTKRYADQKEDSGEAVTQDKAARVFKALEKKGNFILAAALFLMAFLSPRLCDMRRVRRSDILFIPGGIRLTIRGGKVAGQKPVNRIQLTALYSKCVIEAPRSMVILRQCLEASGNKKGLPFSHLSTNEVGKMLRELRKDDIEVTSRCFRKQFAARKFAEEGGDTLRVSQAMRHGNIKMGGAFYCGINGQPAVEEYCQKFGYKLDK